MENIIEELASIEAACEKLINDTESEKKAMSDANAERIAAFDKDKDGEISAAVEAFKDKLQRGQSKALEALSGREREALAAMEEYYKKRHNERTDEIVEKILEV